ncbi:MULTISPECIES: SH3 domain-containing protein [unclassified Marinobacter]|uniref:SH3 domain-containing protein n=1 Tax=unclassified Marinobacter TaxID=83889 RepID=UPI0018F1EBBF|nr:MULTISPECIES: SH3 domain-containing protein [unclassified Marinobacter]
MMLRKPFVVLTLIVPLIWPLQVLAGWGGQVGGWLTNLPVVDAIGEKIIENRIAFVGGGAVPSPIVKGQIRADLGSRANIRNVPGTNGSSTVIEQLNPGDSFVILGQEKGIPWYSIQLSSGRRGFVHQNLVVVNR